MRRTILRTIVLAALVCPAVYAKNNNNDCTALPHFTKRSQTFHQRRHMVGKESPFNLFNTPVDPCDECPPYLGTYALTIEGTRSFRGKQLAECLFGPGLTQDNSCDGATIRISGSQVENRTNRAWLADNFLLARDYEGTIQINPRISDVVVDFDLWTRLDPWYPGLFFAVHLPFVHSRWTLDACETVDQAGTVGYEAGYFAATEIAASQLNTHTALDYLSGRFGLDNVSGITANPLCCSRWASCSDNCNTACTTTCNSGCRSDCDVSNNGNTLTANKLSDVEFILGWRIWDCEDYHFGLEIRGSAPAGTRPDCCFFFEPVVGSGHFGTLGVGITSHLTWWEDCTCERSFASWFDANIIHFFKTRQCRTFDLCGRPNSRYALAMKLNDGQTLSSNPTQATVDGNNILNGPTDGYTPATVPTTVKQFADVYTPVANLTCGKVEVSHAVQVDAVLLFNYTHCHWSFDFGYNAWYLSCEKIDFDCDCPTTRLLNERNMWALKGDAHVYGFEVEPDGTTGQGTATNPVALAGTQSQSSIYTGRNRVCNESVNAEVQRRNPGVDSAEFAYNQTEINGSVRAPLVAVPQANNTSVGDLIADQTRTSNEPVFLGQNDIDIQSARQRGFSNTIFGHIGYTWTDCNCWQPYLGIGGKAEFGRTSNNDCCDFDCSTDIQNCNISTSCGPNNCDTDCRSCKSCALSDWGLWIKGGFSFEG